MNHERISRRSLLSLSAGGLAAAALASRYGRASDDAAASSPFLFIVTAGGGGSIVDSFLPVLQSEVSSSERAERLPAFPEAAVGQPPGSNIRCVRNLTDEVLGPFRSAYDPEQFVARHHPDMLVMAAESASVAHREAQRRAMNGDGIDGGRTLGEAVAMQHGLSQPLPNVVMSSGGFAERGIREDVPDRARGVFVDNARYFALGTDSRKGVEDAPSAERFLLGQNARAELDAVSSFSAEHAGSGARQRFLEMRNGVSEEIQQASLIEQLLLTNVDPENGGLVPSPDLEMLLSQFPAIETDSLQSQAALAFLLARERVSSVLTFGIGVGSPLPEIGEAGTVPATPLAFDFAHSDHLAGQNVNWCRLLEAVDGLISLLKAEPYGDGSMWDRSLIYVASDFGRTREVPEGSTVFRYSSGHELNNGNLFISPMLRGNQVFGGVDAETCMTYGFDLDTGAPNPNVQMNTGHVYSLVAQALGVEFPGQHDMRALLR